MSFMKIPNIDCEKDEDRFRNLHSSEINGVITRVLHELEIVNNIYYKKLRKWEKFFTKKEKREKAKEVLKRHSGEVAIVFPNKFAERFSAGIRSKGLSFSSGVILPRTHTFGKQKQDAGRFWEQKQKTNRFWEQKQGTGKS